VSKKNNDYPEIKKAIDSMLQKAGTFEETKSAIETAIRFEALKLKAKGNDFGKGFDQEGDEDDGP
jgi:hypothetical protein